MYASQLVRPERVLVSAMADRTQSHGGGYSKADGAWIYCLPGLLSFHAAAGRSVLGMASAPDLASSRRSSSSSPR